METPNQYLEWRQPLLAEVFAAMQGCGFSTYLPWGPDRDAQRRLFSESFESTDAIAAGAILIGRRQSPLEMVGEIFRIRRALGGDSSGLWSFGVATSFSDLKAAILAAGSSADSPIFSTAASMPVINCAVCLDDGLDMFFLRLDSHTEQFADRMAAMISDC